MNNTLIDNSIEALSMTTTLRKCLAIDGIKTVSIATGYWDIPGLAILQENLRSFIEKEGTTLRLLIGKDPYIYVNQLKSPKYKDANYPLDFIKTDIHELNVTDEYKDARGVLRDVGRVMDMPYAFVDSIAKMIPQEPKMTIEKALKVNPELRKMCEDDEEVKYLIEMAKRLEGLPRHSSMHAAGVVISQKSVDEYVPLSRAADGSVTTQFTMTTLEQLGLLKMDFLGLRTLTVIQNAVLMARKKDPSVNMDTLDYDDKKVLEYIGTGKTDGIFQLESAGMKSFMKELKPNSLEDMIAGISLYRPGPMDFIPQYIKGKNDASSISYDCPQLEPILNSTYGCIVYQEQVMQIVRDLAGYSLGRSDLLRRAMSKKKGEEMKRERQIFLYGDEASGIPGCVKNGIDEQVANKIYDEMLDFANYAFNKSHAAAYAVVAYQTAWLKYYYPVEYMAALMTSVIDNPSKVAEYIYASRQMGIQILPPDINNGEADF